MNLHGIIALESIQLLETIEEEVVVEEKKSASTPTTTPTTPTTPATSTTPSSTENTEQQSSKKAETQGATTQTPETSQQQPTNEIKKEKRKKVLKFDVPFNSQVFSGLESSLVNKFTEEENKMRSSDKLAEETVERKNALESYILNTRKRLDGDLLEYSTEEERENFKKLLTEAEDWLYGDGDDTTKSAYIEKTTELMRIGNPIESRRKEDINTEEAHSEVLSLANNYKNSLNSEKYDHIDKAEKDKVIEKCHAIEKQSNELINKKKAQPKHSNPVVATSEFVLKKKELEKFCNEILSKPKPVPNPKADEKKESTPQGNDDKKGQEAPQNDDKKPSSTPPPTNEQSTGEKGNGASTENNMDVENK